MYKDLENRPQPSEREIENERLREEWTERIRARYKESCQLRGERDNINWKQLPNAGSPEKRQALEQKKEKIAQRESELINEDRVDLEKAKRDGYYKEPSYGQEMYGYGG